jgi:DNA-directed RNA polymerase subunit RPC12/RpoP
VLVPYECSACGLETVFEQAPVNALSFLEINCSACGQRMRFAGVPEQYQTFCENHDIAG